MSYEPRRTSYEENFADALDTVLGMRRMAENAWENEQLEAAEAIMDLNRKAYTLGYFHALEDAETINKGESPDFRPNHYFKLPRKTQ